MPFVKIIEAGRYGDGVTRLTDLCACGYRALKLRPGNALISAAFTIVAFRAAASGGGE